ncbi:MAG: hypothetical protein FWF12_06870 [Betaproteobacteria bacterium]|nr:hypothetical protein [Betaproteobacteria bacterium]
MIGFGHYDRTVAEIVKEIAVCCVLLKLDWTDRIQVRALAHESLHCTSEQRLAMLRAPDERAKTQGKLFALLILLLDITRQAAQAGVRITSDSGLWQALDRAFTEAYGWLDGNAHSSA